ncbi:hypothetical protein DL767_000235 [Monosporascus sp. MG133]|nr:hypothetical protein DL767_000235 [Monosporascus sp. MG133]
MSASASQAEGVAGMDDVLKALGAIQESQRRLATEVESVSQRLDALAPTAITPSPNTGIAPGPPCPDRERSATAAESITDASSLTTSAAVQAQKSGFTSRIVLTTYPKQNGIDPLPLDWGAPDASRRGPVVVSRSSSTIRRRNAIGGEPYLPAVSSSSILRFLAHGGSYSIYFALALASKQLNANHRPNFTNTEPAASIGPFPQWGDKKKIVAMDPWGHLAPWLFADTIEKENVDIRPTIAITKAHMKLITRGDIKVFLPPIGGLTVYCFGDPAKMSDEKSRLALRIHDECNGSDVFGSDICTCRPYLIFGIEEAVREAQNGGSGVVIYFRKEGRALGEVTKVWLALRFVYNARKRGEDRASDYFKRTENVAGVKDMRFQALMPDILHWLGIKKIDRMLSMSNMKYDAIVGQGIPIHERVELPEELIPADSRVEIDAKITAGHSMLTTCEYVRSRGTSLYFMPPTFTSPPRPAKEEQRLADAANLGIGLVEIFMLLKSGLLAVGIVTKIKGQQSTATFTATFTQGLRYRAFYYHIEFVFRSPNGAERKSTSNRAAKSCRRIQIEF